MAQLCDEALMILDPVVNKEESEKVSKIQRNVGNLRNNSKEITENKKDIALMELKEAIDQALEREGKKL